MSAATKNTTTARAPQYEEWRVTIIKPAYGPFDYPVLSLISLEGGRRKSVALRLDNKSALESLGQIGLTWDGKTFRLHSQELPFGTEAAVNWVARVKRAVSQQGRPYLTLISASAQAEPAPSAEAVAPAPMAQPGVLLLPAKLPKYWQHFSNRGDYRDRPVSHMERRAINAARPAPAAPTSTRRQRVAARLRDGLHLTSNGTVYWLPQPEYPTESHFEYGANIAQDVKRSTRYAVYSEVEKLLDVTFMLLRGDMTLEQFTDQVHRFDSRVRHMATQPAAPEPAPETIAVAPTEPQPTPDAPPATDVYGNPADTNCITAFAAELHRKRRHLEAFRTLMKECTGLDVSVDATTFITRSNEWKYELFRGYGEDKLRLLIYRRCGGQWIKSLPVGTLTEANRERNRLQASYYEEMARLSVQANKSNTSKRRDRALIQ